MDDRTLASGLVQEAYAPERLIVVWSRRDLSEVVSALALHGELPVLVDPHETATFIEQAGAPALLLIDADILDAEVEVPLMAVRQRHPEMRTRLLADASSTGAVLLRAMRAGVHEVLDPTQPSEVEALAAELRSGTRGQERVLAVGAHPDDVEIGCGGTLLRHRAAGHAITVLTLSRGAVGGAQEFRRREAVSASMMLGAELVMGDLPDTRIGEAHEAIGLIESVIARARPSVVYVHSTWDNHQDHRAVHDATMVAARLVPQVLCYQSPSSRNGFDPTRFVPITETVHEKVRLLEQYASQASRHYLDPDLVIASARYWARQLPDARYVEPFEVVRASGGDPFSNGQGTRV